MPVLKDMEMFGVLVDMPYLQAMSKSVGTQIHTLERQIYDLAGHPFNLNSPKQLGDVLFQELNLPVIRSTKTGPSTDAAVLEELSDAHPIMGLLLEYRKSGQATRHLHRCAAQTRAPQDGPSTHVL